MRLFLLLSILAISASGLLAEVRYKVVGDTLIFNMTIEEPGFEFTKGVETYDITAIKNYLFEHPQIRKLKLTGPGGSGEAGTAIGANLLLHDIDTDAFGECLSACANIFLAGRKRTLAPNSTLGFHRPWVVKETEKKFYEANRVEENWVDEFDYVTLVYEDAIEDVIEGIRFMRSRGVEMDFILKILSTSSFDMWEPTREELHEAGVLTDVD